MRTDSLILILLASAIVATESLLPAQGVAPGAPASTSSPAPYLPNTQPHRFNPPEEDAHWRLTVMPYLWAASLKGSVTVKGVTSQVEASFADIFKGLDYAFIGQAELQHGRFFIIPDTLLLKLSQSVTVDGTKTGKFGLVNDGQSIGFGRDAHLFPGAGCRIQSI